MPMSEHYQHIARLIVRKLRNKLDPEGNKELELWMAESDENRRLVENCMTPEYWITELMDYKSIDVDKLIFNFCFFKSATIRSIYLLFLCRYLLKVLES